MKGRLNLPTAVWFALDACPGLFYRNLPAGGSTLNQQLVRGGTDGYNT